MKFILAATNLWDSVAGAPNNEMKEQVQQIIAEENAAGHNDMTYKLLENITGYGCGWHPDMATQSGWSNDVATHPLLNGLELKGPLLAPKKRLYISFSFLALFS